MVSWDSEALRRPATAYAQTLAAIFSGRPYHPRNDNLMIQFDPTYNYGDSDLINDKNLAYWKFGELIKTLVTMTCNADKQIEIMGAGIVTDDMAEDFYSYYTLSFKELLDCGLLTEISNQKLKELNDFFDDRNGSKDPDFWDDLQLATNKDWQIVRAKASEILTMLNMDNLELEFDRTEKYETTAQGQKLIMQTTKSRLRRKNSC